MKWMYMNLYGSNIQIWTQTKMKNAPKDQQTQNINLDSNQIKKQKLSTKSTLHGFDDKLGETWLRQNKIGFRN